MSLTLVIGPANAEKAGRVLGAYRDVLARGEEPILVVPNLDDVEYYRRELSASQAVFGVRVVRFRELFEEVALRGGVTGRPPGRLARERVIAAAIARTELGPLASSAGTAGFATALGALLDELGDVIAGPARAVRALQDWGAADPARAAYATDLAALVSAYHRQLAQAGAVDEQVHQAAAVDALRLDPGAWGPTPVFVYGFDDLTPLQRDALQAIATSIGAEVMVSLTFEAGREVFRSRARLHQDLLADGATVEELEPNDASYAEGSRAALHHLERSLFEQEAQAAAAGDALLAFSSGGERAEIELVGAHVARLLREGWAPEDVAVIFRSLPPIASAVAEVFEAFGIPAAVERSIPVGHTALGRGLLGLLAAASGGGAEDLLAFLRTPGVVSQPERVDRIERSIRRGGVRSAAKARGLWEERNWPLDQVARVQRAAAAGPGDLCRALAREAAFLLERPHHGAAAVLDPLETVDARAAGALRASLIELGTLADRDPSLVPTGAELARALAELEVPVGLQPGPGRVSVTEPGRIRARRVRALFACGLRDGAWPSRGRPDALLTDADRFALAQASGLVLRPRNDRLAGEEFLFYTSITRPEELLVLSRRTVDDGGDETAESPFAAEVVRLFSGLRDDDTTRRRLGQADWPEGLAPTERERRRSLALQTTVAPPQPGPLIAAPVLARLAEPVALSPTDLETWLSCPVRWLVERFVRARDLEPDPEAILRGTLAHAVLKDVLEATGGRPLAPDDLAALRDAVQESLAARGREILAGISPDRLRTELRRAEADLLRYVAHAARAGSAYGPRHLELAFEEMLEGELLVKGTIDRVDTAGGEALIYDYKGEAKDYPHARWEETGALQMGLYILAARQLLDVDVVGGLYQPLRSRTSLQPRGIHAEGADPDRIDLVSTDVLSREELEAVLRGVLVRALQAAGELRSGALEARPETCAFGGGGCAYPSICRSVV